MNAGGHAPHGLFATPPARQRPGLVRQSSGAPVPFAARLGKPEAAAGPACHIVTDGHLDGEGIRPDRVPRMAPL